METRKAREKCNNSTLTAFFRLHWKTAESFQNFTSDSSNGLFDNNL